MEHRLPPHDVNSEKALIGACLIRPDSAVPAADEHQITEDSFYLPGSRDAYEAILEMWAGGKAIDMNTVGDRLKGRELESFLHECVDACTMPSQAGAYAEIVREKQVRRRVIEEGMRAGDEAYKPEPGGGDRGIEIMADAVASLTDVRGSEGPAIIAEIAKNTVQGWKRAEETGFDGVPSAWEPINRIIGGYAYGELSIVAGYRGEGKSLYMCNEALAAASRGISTLVISLEMPKEKVAARIIGNLGNFSTFKMDIGKGGGADWDSVQDGVKKVSSLPIYIADGDFDLNDICRLIRLYVSKYGVKFVVLDYIQLARIRQFRGNRNNEVSEISRRLALRALQHRIHVMALSQFSRDPDKADRPPRLSDLRDSGSLEQDARMVILLYKDPKSEPELVNGREEWTYLFEVAKHNSGPAGVVRFKRISNRQRWEPEVSHEYEAEGRSSTGRSSTGRSSTDYRPKGTSSLNDAEFQQLQKSRLTDLPS